MKRTIVSFAAAIALLLTPVVPALGEEPASREEDLWFSEAVRCAVEESLPEESYVELSYPLLRQDLPEEDSVTLRFYRETPNVAYLGIGAGYRLLAGGEAAFSVSDGVCTLTTPTGGSLTAIPEENTLRSADYHSFRDDLSRAKCGETSTFYDGSPFGRVRDVVYEGEPQPMEIDFDEYGIAMYADGSDVYLPLSVVSMLLEDNTTRHMQFNGEEVYVLCFDAILSLNPLFYDTPYFNAVLSGAKRPEDLVAYAYGEICFAFDHLYGHPGRVELDAVIGELGLDAALQSLGATGNEIRDMLCSRNMLTFLKGTAALNAIVRDGHTFTFMYLDIMEIGRDNVRAEARSELMAAYSLYVNRQEDISRQLTESDLSRLRQAAWGKSGFYMSGDTAVLYLPDFFTDYEGWEYYYEYGGVLPDDTVGRTVRALNAASKNPSIKNFVFDMTDNPGGTTDGLAALQSLLFNKSALPAKDMMTGQRYHVFYEIDRNLDGKFDEADELISYDFRYAVLCARFSFSCGNYFPSVMHHEGVPLLGEPTGGGSCCIFIPTVSEGLCYYLSSYLYQIQNEAGEPIEGGTPVDIPLETGRKSVSYYMGTSGRSVAEIDDYAAWFDISRLSGEISDWYDPPEEAAA